MPLISERIKGNLSGKGLSEGETRATIFFVKVGIWVVVCGVAAIIGLAMTFSADPTLKWWGWQVLRVGLLMVFLLMDLAIGGVATWAWRQSRSVAGLCVFGFFLLGTMGAVAALFLGLRDLADSLFYVMATLGLVAIVISFVEDRRKKAERTSAMDSEGPGPR